MSDSRLKEQFSERLAQLCDEKGLPERGRQSMLARDFGVSQGAVRKWLTGGAFPEMEMALRLADHFDVNVNWLLQGTGPKRGDRVDMRALVANDILSSGSPELRKEFLDYIKFKVSTAADAMFPREQRDRTLRMIDEYEQASRNVGKRH